MGKLHLQIYYKIEKKKTFVLHYIYIRYIRPNKSSQIQSTTHISQHIFYDEMPHNSQSTNLEYNAIYCYNTEYIGHSVYEDVSKTMQLFNEIEKL